MSKEDHHPLSGWQCWLRGCGTPQEAGVAQVGDVLLQWPSAGEITNHKPSDGSCIGKVQLHLQLCASGQIRMPLSREGQRTRPVNDSAGSETAPDLLCTHCRSLMRCSCSMLKVSFTSRRAHLCPSAHHRFVDVFQAEIYARAKAHLALAPDRNIARRCSC